MRKRNYNNYTSEVAMQACETYKVYLQSIFTYKHWSIKPNKYLCIYHYVLINVYANLFFIMG